MGDSFREWVPKVDDPRWQQYLGQLAEAADARTTELGDEMLQSKPQWAIEGLGPVPEEIAGQSVWARRAGVVAAHRELTGHDDPATALGAAPRPGQAEAYASWRAAWRALGRPEADRAEAEMSDGRLRIRVRAWERERTWGPRYVANELAGTHQAADRYRATAALRAAEADAASAGADRDRLAQEARDARAFAQLLEARTVELAEADRARGFWYAHTAPTRVAADRASAELAAREAEHPVEEPAVTAEEWLAEHRAAAVAEDPHRVVADEVDLADAQAERDIDVATAFPEPPNAAELEQDVQRPIPGPVSVDEDVVRVPTAEETAATIARARQALAEVHRRDALDAYRAAAEGRAEQLAQWHEQDVAAEMSLPDPALESEPALGIGTPWD